MRVTPTAAIYAVHWGGPAFQAGLTVGETIVSVDGKPYDPKLLTDAVRQAASGGSLELVVKRGRWQQKVSTVWQGGLRYPHLRRTGEEPAMLDSILASKVQRTQEQARC